MLDVIVGIQQGMEGWLLLWRETLGKLASSPDSAQSAYWVTCATNRTSFLAAVAALECFLKPEELISHTSVSRIDLKVVRTRKLFGTSQIFDVVLNLSSDGEESSGEPPRAIEKLQLVAGNIFSVPLQYAQVVWRQTDFCYINRRQATR